AGCAPINTPSSSKRRKHDPKNEGGAGDTSPLRKRTKPCKNKNRSSKRPGSGFDQSDAERRGPAIGQLGQLELHPLPFIQRALGHPLSRALAGARGRALNGGGMHEHVLHPIVGTNEPKALLAVEPLDFTRCHFRPPPSCRNL